MKEYFKKYKYLFPSASLLTATLVMLIFDSHDVADFLTKLGKTFWYALLTGFGIYILSVFSSWLLFPFIPKHEDFSNNEEREEYSNLGNWDMWVFVYLIIAVTLVFSGFIQ